MLQRILVPLDGTTDAAEALPVAAALARASGASLVLLHLLEASAPRQVHGQLHLSGRTEAERYLQDCLSRPEMQNVQATWHIHEEPVSEVARGVTEHEVELKPDLIVMRPHGAWSLSHRLFGSQAQRIAGGGAVPILMLRPGTDGRIVYPFGRILLPLEEAPDHDAVLPVVRELAGATADALDLLTVIPAPQSQRWRLGRGTAPAPAAEQELLELRGDHAEGRLQTLLEELNRAGCHPTARLLRGDPLTRILDAAESGPYALTALGTHGRYGLSAFWEGSLAARLISRLPGSILLVPVPEHADDSTGSLRK